MKIIDSGLKGFCHKWYKEDPEVTEGVFLEIDDTRYELRFSTPEALIDFRTSVELTMEDAVFLELCLNHVAPKDKKGVLRCLDQ